MSVALVLLVVLLSYHQSCFGTIYRQRYKKTILLLFLIIIIKFTGSFFVQSEHVMKVLLVHFVSVVFFSCHFCLIFNYYIHNV